MIRRFKRWAHRLVSKLAGAIVYVSAAVLGVPAVGVVIRVVFRSGGTAQHPPGTSLHPVQ